MNDKHLYQNPQYVKSSFKQMKMLSSISLAILLLTGILAGCGRTVEDGTPTAELESEPKEETKQNQTEELDAIVAQFGLEDIKLADQEHIYLRQRSTNGEIQKLWTAESKNKSTEESSLQSAIQAYIQEIGLDLMVRNQSNKSFRGMEEELSEEELGRLTKALEDAAWTPAHLNYVPQEQQWLFELEGQQVYFVLYYDEQTAKYLLEAFLYHENPEKAVLEPIALYGIKPQIQVDSIGYWDYTDNNVKSICYKPEDASRAFPENRQEVTEQLWQQAQTQILSSEEQDIILSESTPDAPATENSSAGNLVPAKLIQMAKEALYTRDWSAFDELAAPLELTDHDKALETWAASVENMQDGTGDWFLTADKEEFDYFKQHICHIYQYNIGESQFLLFVVDTGGSARFVDIFCYRLTENGYEHINSVGTLDLNARVVPYEGGFYLVDTIYNYYSKYKDTIYLYPLTSEGISEQAVQITLAPVDYIWTSAYQSGAPVQEQVDDYVLSIQKELMDASPINDDITVFTGCEEPVTDPVKLQRLFNKNSWYVVDYDNDGLLEYLRRYYWFPSNYTTLLLLTEEYRLEDITWKLGESWEPECPYWSDTLIQRWYQEFDGQVYTFQLFLTEGYNYFMNVSLWEKEQVSWIASYYVTPRCELQVETAEKEMVGAG